MYWSLGESDTHQMTSLLREGVYEKRPAVSLSGQVETDELYLIAGHKGQPEAVKKSEASPAEDNPSGLGVLERGGQVRIWLLDNVKQATIRLLLEQTVQPP